MLEEIVKCGQLTANELAQLTSDVPFMDVSKCACCLWPEFGCHTLYDLSGVTNAPVVHLKTTEIDTIQRYVSHCKKDLHIILKVLSVDTIYFTISIYSSLPFGLVNQIVDSTVQYVL